MNKKHSQNEASIINWGIVEEYIKKQFPDLGQHKLEVGKFSIGYSNLTYFIRMGNWEAVLRRPPFGPIPPKAHDMKREYEILSKLHHVFPLAPEPYLYCDDPNIMDRHFYIMEKKDGVVMDNELPPEYGHSEKTGTKISEAVIDTLTKLHSIDYKEADLASIGYPDGYLTRQVHGWIKRYHHSKTDDAPNVEGLEKWLVDHIPTSPSPTIVHNDFKINNMMFSSEDPGNVIGLFDWEMCTIGDPLTDLGAALAYWTEQNEGNTGLTSVTTNPGFVTRRELLQMYATKSGRDVTNIDYYLAFSFYKIAVILQQIYYRWKIGKATDERFGRLNIGIENLLKQAEKAKNKQVL